MKSPRCMMSEQLCKCGDDARWLHWWLDMRTPKNLLQLFLNFVNALISGVFDYWNIFVLPKWRFGAAEQLISVLRPLHWPHWICFLNPVKDPAPKHISHLFTVYQPQTPLIIWSWNSGMELKCGEAALSQSLCPETREQLVRWPEICPLSYHF